MSRPTHLPVFLVKQKLAVTANRYEILAVDPDGGLGHSLALAQQKRTAFKEEVTFYADESRSQPVFSFKARKKLDLGSGYDIYDDQHRQIGFFRKDFGASLMRSTFHLESAGVQATGQERSKGAAIARRLVNVPFLPVHFDFVTPSGGTVLQVERQSSAEPRLPGGRRRRGRPGCAHGPLRRSPGARGTTEGAPRRAPRSPPGTRSGRLRACACTSVATTPAWS